MMLNQYQYLTTPDRLTYQFTSMGKKEVTKIVQYLPKWINNLKVYNLAFGDLEENGKLNDMITSNNGDMVKVLATVANTIFDFIACYPQEIIYAKGSNLIRTKLYQRKITEMFKEINLDFELYGINVYQQIEAFQLDVPYTAFLVKKK